MGARAILCTMSAPSPSDLADFLRRRFGLDAEASQAGLEGEGDGAGEQGRSLDVVGRPRGFFEAAAETVAAKLEGWSRSPRVRSLIGGVERDILVGPGEAFSIRAAVGVRVPGRGKTPMRAQLCFDGDVVATRELGDASHVDFSAQAPEEAGIHALSVELDDGESRTVMSGSSLLQVAASRPCVLFDAALLLPDPKTGQKPDPTDFELVRRIADADFELAYFDIAETNRESQIHEVIVANALPRRATLIYAAEEQNLRSMGAQFDRMFMVTAVRRLRARGVAVQMLVTRRLDGPDGEEAPLLARPGVPDDARSLLRTPERAREELTQGAAGMREAAARWYQKRAAADPRRWRLTQATGARPFEGNALRFELDNRRARERYFALVDGAQRSIHLQFYIVRPSRFAEELIVRLIRKARSGVQVRMMVDALYSEEEILGRLNPLIASLRDEPGAEVMAIGPIPSREDLGLVRLKRRDHRKLLVVDGREAIVSGRNASDEYYQGFDEVAVHDNTHHDRIPWLDAHVELRGPLAGEVGRCFVETWLSQGGSALEPDEGATPDGGDAGAALSGTWSGSGSAATASTGCARLVVHHGLRDANGLTMYEAMLDGARDDVILVNDFPIVVTLERAILRQLDRGVRVRLVTGSAATRRVDGSFFPAPMHRTAFEYMVKARLEPLARAGVEIYEYVTPPSDLVVARGGALRPYVHAKLMCVDGEVCSIGSANLDATASFWESEANVVVEDRAFGGALRAELEAIIARAHRLDLSSDEWTREATQRAVLTRLWPDTLYS